MLKRKDNKLNLEFFAELTAVLDKIEATKGPGVVVTIGTGNKHFSTGFDMEKWMEDTDRYYLPMINRFPQIMDRLIRLQLPSMCVFNGNAMAGGFFFGVCHDFRIMTTQHGRLCCNELLFERPLNRALMASLKYKLGPSAVFKLHIADMMLPKEGLKHGIIDNVYKDEADLTAQIHGFAKRFAPIGVHRLAIKINKENQYR